MHLLTREWVAVGARLLDVCFPLSSCVEGSLHPVELVAGGVQRSGTPLQRCELLHGRALWGGVGRPQMRPKRSAVAISGCLCWRGGGTEGRVDCILRSCWVC